MNRYLRTIFLVVTLFSCTTICAQKTYVVSVGISDYKYPDIAPSLPCSINDVKAVSHFFNDYNGSQVFMLLDGNATREHILKVLSTEFAKSTPDDEIIFVFSGHGVPGGLTTYETRDMNSVISYNEIQDIMKSAKARRKIILAMACYSGGLNLVKKQSSDKGQKRKTEKTSVMLYTSSRADEPSWENTKMKNSFFISRVLQALKGAADANADNKVTARELFNYVNPAVIVDTGGLQHPQMWGNFDDSMVVVYVKSDTRF